MSKLTAGDPLADALLDLGKLCGNSRQNLEAFYDRLQFHQPSDVRRAVEQLGRTWTFREPPRLADLLKLLPRLDGEAQPAKPFAGFWWDVATGEYHGDPGKLTPSERAEAADTILQCRVVTKQEAELVNLLDPTAWDRRKKAS